MKKILFGILTIFGIGLSFCSADGIYHNSTLGLISIVVNGETIYTLSDKNLGATCIDITDSCSHGNYYQWGNNYPFSFQSYSKTNCPFASSSTPYGPGNYFNSNGIFCSTILGPSGRYSNAWGAVTNTFEAMQGPCSSGFHVPYSWSGFISSLSSSFSINLDFFKSYLFFPQYGTIFGSNGNSSTNGAETYYINALYNNNNINYNYYLRFFTSSYSISSTDILVGGYVRCFKNELVEPDYTWSVLYGDTIQNSNPKFKVNYGSNSYEYELSDNLEIHLKSSVNMSGSYNYIYDGPTGINLFYNNTSDFYNKDKLYLKSMYWYNKNIFTPICL